MSRRLQQLIALWFVLQILLPFTAPLQTLDLRDFFGAKSHHAATSPESTTTPTMSGVFTGTSLVSTLTSTTLRDNTSAVAMIETPLAASLMSAHLPAPQVQRSVLRL